MAKAKSKAAYMISSVAEQYEIHPQTLRLYEREGLLKPSRSDGNTRLYTESDLERLEVILHLTRDLGVNLAGVEIILNMREKMGRMQSQIEEFVATLNRELAARPQYQPEKIQRNWVGAGDRGTRPRTQAAGLAARRTRPAQGQYSEQTQSDRQYPGWFRSVDSKLGLVKRQRFPCGGLARDVAGVGLHRRQ